MAGYLVLFTDAADGQVEGIFDGFAQLSLATAERWLDGLRQALATRAANHASMPGVRHLAPENAAFPDRDVMVLIYRAPRSHTVWRVLYDLPDLDGDGEPDTLRVLRVQHGAMERRGPEEE